MSGITEWVRLGLALSFFSAALPSAFPQTNRLRPVADTSLFEPNPNNNLGRSADVAAGTTVRGLRTRALFKFGVGGTNVPTGATITSAKLTIRVVKQPQSSPASSTFTLHRVLQNWGEGTKSGNTGSSGGTNEATWNARIGPSNPWTLPGARAPEDYAAAASASRVISGLASYTFDSTPAMVADVQGWLDDTNSNFGWIMISQAEATLGTARRIGTREGGGNSPILEVTYTVGPGPGLEAPTNLVAAATNSLVTLAWNPVTGATGYNVSRGTNSGGPYLAVATNIVTTNFSDTNVLNGTAYFYVVAALNATSQSTNSVEVSATPLSTAIPSLLIQSPQVVSNQFVFGFTAESGRSYAVQFVDAFGQGPFLLLTNVVNPALTSQPVVISEPLSVSPRRFYRVEILQVTVQ